MGLAKNTLEIQTENWLCDGFGVEMKIHGEGHFLVVLS